MKRSLARVTPIVVALACAPSVAHAQGNPGSAPAGGRSALMGNTGVALASDGAAPVLNPATILRVTDTRLALSVNFYGYEHTRVDGFFDAGATNDDRALGRHTFTTLPSTFCVFVTLVADKIVARAELPRPRHKLALCLGSSERASFEAIGLGASSGAASETRSLVRGFGRTYAGPSYALALSDAIAVGTSLHLVQTSATWVTFGSTSRAVAGGATTSALERATDLSSWDLAATLGATYRLDRDTTIGMRVSTPLGHLTGGLDATDVRSSLGAAGATARQRALSGSASAPVVPSIAVGIGRELPRVSVEANATLHLPLFPLLSAELEGHEVDAQGARRDIARVIEERGRAALGAAAGVEVHATPTLGVLGGLATDLSIQRPLRSAPSLGEIGHARRQRVLLSGGIATRDGATELLVGAQLGLGWGRTLAIDAQGASESGLRVVDERSTTVLLVVAGNASLSGLRRSIDHLRGR